ncbi:hypothetical protein D8T32_17515 [Vibrio vulnificus]|uniref:hypothetical protein n=1 Tax=Vibrio metoecus TaxID=1481663 RepID=UPI000BA94DB3|nr:hypothetical protein [Vibrio metoecus]EGR0752729.1 hypothetical protein [Vibrio vulnificus]ELA9072315.1 hypothetical protein [Vibrio parahaemolyticus]PAR48032.1 hypothetical protein CGT95_04610 [Vibrio metoecus]HCH6039219.1 hypothetical protein [Vibrio parahaemolyticus]
MAKFFEVFGESASTVQVKDKLESAICPMSGGQCDGGGNRHQTKLSKSELEELVGADKCIKGTIPAICSINYEKSNDAWIVCPRRLFAFPKTQDKKVNTSPKLMGHERSLINSIGFESGSLVGVYPEVYLKYSDEDSEINYHFDYVICELLESEMSLSELWSQMGITESKEKDKYKKHLRDNGLIGSRSKDTDKILFYPNLDKMAIIEVMTASTSGSNKEKGTDIKSAYIKFSEGLPYECPGINKRQVWGRMATQLFAKTALSQSWGAATYWVVQDKLLDNICKTTKLELKKTDMSENTVNFVSYAYEADGVLSEPNILSLDAGVSFSGTGTAVDILLAKTNPDLSILLSSIVRTQLACVIRV